MTARFVALPVGQGDAFFLERAGLRVLVDGGKSRTQCVEYLKQQLHEKHLDVVICSHNDKDHAEGVRGLLESEAFDVGEVWLPGRWTDRLVELCRDDADFYKELGKQVSEAPQERTLEGDWQFKTQTRSAQEPRREGAEDAELLNAIESAEEGPFRWWRGPVPSTNMNLWNECIQAADRIQGIAVAARNLGARIRWFDFDEFQKNGPQKATRADLVPMNAVEITGRIRRPVPSALEFLTLSVANRESLVFRSAPDNEAPGVLFTADSDLQFDTVALRVDSGDLVTSPHHGSEANSDAYDVVDGLAAERAETLTWIRSDGRFRSRPGARFLSKQKQAACTRCRGFITPGQAVELSGSPERWSLAKPPCACAA